MAHFANFKFLLIICAYAHPILSLGINCRGSGLCPRATWNNDGVTYPAARPLIHCANHFNQQANNPSSNFSVMLSTPLLSHSLPRIGMVIMSFAFLSHRKSLSRQASLSMEFPVVSVSLDLYPKAASVYFRSPWPPARH